MSLAVTVQGTQEGNWNKEDTVWGLSLYGTAIGAGTLFLPINAGLHGIWPLIIMALIAFPMTYFSHQALCRFVLSGSRKQDITGVVDEHFGPRAGKVLTFLYFFAIYPILLMYSVAITNTTNSFLLNQLHLTPPPRAVLALALILALMVVVRFGQHMIVKSMSVLVYPFVAALLLLSLYLIPYWNTSVFHYHASPTEDSSSMWMTVWLIIPVMVFSFNHSPIISSFAVRQRDRYGTEAEQRSSGILRFSHAIMITTVMLFVFSCVLSLSPQDLALAKQQNISILSYLANHFHAPIIAYLAPIIAFIAIAKSFLGHYLGASEGLHGLVYKSMAKREQPIKKDHVRYGIDAFIVVTCWMVATWNPSILKMIETLGGPIIAVILFLMPMYAIVNVPTMQRYRHPIRNGFITVTGLIAISAIFYSLW